MCSQVTFAEAGRPSVGPPPRTSLVNTFTWYGASARGLVPVAGLTARGWRDGSAVDRVVDVLLEEAHDLVPLHRGGVDVHDRVDGVVVAEAEDHVHGGAPQRRQHAGGLGID